MADATEWPAARVRSTFVEFFESKEHTNYTSSPVVPHDDPTLLFANAGMNQFKPIFLGQADPNGGKHNDLDDVGKDTYHHTFFEMLGSWSFGDYFKTEAITYFEGDEADGIPADEEAKALWLKFLPEDHILPGNKKDNFWEMGDVGPCGPCSEIHFDRIGGRNASSLVNQDDPNVLEIWNLVFMQFNRDTSGKLTSLPAKHIDTGMGFERLTSIMQNRMSNYDTDVFMPLFEAIQQITGVRAYSGLLGKEDADGIDMAYRVLADHARTLTFAIADGAVPSNEGRGYVLRRILRRAVRYGQQFMNAEPGFFAKLVPVVVSVMKDAFPELPARTTFVMEVIAEEEAAFNRTLSRGLKFFRQRADEVKAAGEDTVSGEVAFYLYDTLGFPLDLTVIMAEEDGLKVDTEGFNTCMQDQRLRSQQARASARGVKQLVLEAAQTAWLSETSVPVTNDDPKYIWHENPQSTIRAIYLDNNKFAEDEAIGSDVDGIGIILDATSFYAEAGGQIADVGTLELGDGEAVFDVEDVRVFAGYVLHIGSVRKGTLRVGDQVSSCVNYDRRGKVAPNHTMTHVLNFALRKVVGDSVDQRGSLVDDEKLRFDFSNNKGLTTKQIEQVEMICNDVISAALPVHTKVAPLADARAIQSLRAVFGETYPDPVRVVSVGADVDALLKDPENAEWSDLSVEFCGGTHLSNTAKAGQFVLVEESSIAKGIRRIVAVTREAANEAADRGSELLSKLSTLKSMKGDSLQAGVTELTADVNAAMISAAVKAQIRTEIKALEKVLLEEKKAAAAARTEEALATMSQAITTAREAGATAVVVSLPGLTPKDGKKIFTCANKDCTDMPFLGVGDDGSTLPVLVTVPKAIVDAKGLTAGEWLNATIEQFGGKGGGSPVQAQGQVKDVSKTEEVLAAARAFAESKLA